MGIIQTNWDLTYDDGVTVFTGDDVDAVFDITLLDPGHGKPTQKLHRRHSANDGNFDIAYAYNAPATYLRPDGEFFNAMSGVVDEVIAPLMAGLGSMDNYNSTYDFYTSQGTNPHGNGTSQPWPGYVNSQAEATNLVNDLAQAATRNFYFFGHGDKNPAWLGDNIGVNILGSWVSSALTNYATTGNGFVARHPYRFVFLDACYSDANKDWRHAFGFFFPKNNKGTTGLPRAFMGWADPKWSLGADKATEVRCHDYGVTLHVFFALWMNGTPLEVCMKTCCLNRKKTNPGLYLPFRVPGNEQCTLSDGTPYNTPTTVLRIVGYHGLTRNGCAPGY